jgi:hypothetical protein
MDSSSQEHAPTARDGQGDPTLADSSAALTVETAAIWIGATVFTLPRPNRHHNIIWWLSALGVKSSRMHEQGFVLSNGEYVSRKEAAEIALRAGQVTALISPPNLYSEDLWDGGADLPTPEVITALAHGTGVGPSPTGSERSEHRDEQDA